MFIVLLMFSLFVNSIYMYDVTLVASMPVVRFSNLLEAFNPFVICAIAIAYSMGQIIKSVCVCQCICLSVCDHSHGCIS